MIARPRLRALVAPRATPTTPPGEAIALAAGRLRAGAEPGDAWQGIELSVDGAPAATVRAARSLAVEVGAPLAELLDEVGAGVSDDESAAAERRAALAGPASTGRILGWLPVAGSLLALALGADVLAVARDGGVGTVSVVVGTVLLLAGRAWSRALVRAAERSAR